MAWNASSGKTKSIEQSTWRPTDLRQRAQTLKITFDSRRGDGLGQHGCSALNGPADQDLGRGSFQLLCDFDDEGVIDGSGVRFVIC